KVILGPAIRNGLIDHDPFRELKLKAKPVHREFLSQDEIEKLERVQLPNKDQELKRDIFLFSCYTGLAYIDIKQLSAGHFIKDPDGSYYILKPRQKTGQESIIPLLPPAVRILQKYALSSDLTSFKWTVCSNQKMNQGLKEI